MVIEEYDMLLLLLQDISNNANFKSTENDEMSKKVFRIRDILMRSPCPRLEQGRQNARPLDERTGGGGARGSAASGKRCSLRKAVRLAPRQDAGEDGLEARAPPHPTLCIATVSVVHAGLYVRLFYFSLGASQIRHAVAFG